MNVARLAGILYLILIACGIWAEGGVRSAAFVPGDPAETAARILSAEGAFRWALLADALMASCDVAIAVLLFVLFQPVAPVMAGLALGFRLTQAAILGANLLNHNAALLAVGEGSPFSPDQAAAQAYFHLQAHSYGYDLGLIFFGVNCLITGALILWAGWPRLLALGIAAAGVVYLIGSGLRILAPALSDSFAYVYVIALVAELALALWLLRGGDMRREPPGNR